MKTLLLLFLFISCSSVDKKSGISLNHTSSVLDKVIKQVDMSEYELKTMTVVDTSFHLLGRRQGGLGLDRLERSLIKMWPTLAQGFSNHPDEVAIIEIQGLTSSGQKDEFFLQIAHDETQDKKILKKHYQKFRNAKQAFTDDLVMHSLVFLFFGNKSKDGWFGEGLRLLYADLAWNSIIKNPSPWSQSFTTINEVNSMKALAELRNQIGAEIFDKTIDQLTSQPGQEWVFDDFIDALPKETREHAEELQDRQKALKD